MFLKSFWKSIIWAIIIFILCSISVPEIKKVSLIEFENMDKVVHGVFYLILGILLVSSFKKYKKPVFKNPFYLLVLSFFIAISYGILIELLQYSIFTYRSAELLDVLCNTLGAFLGVLIYKYLVKIKILEILI